MRKIFILLILVCLSSYVSSYTFGVFPGENERRTSDLSEKVTIGFINIGDQDLKVDFQAKDSSEYNVSFPKNTIIRQSEVTSNPSGNGRWYQIENGRYVRVQQEEFRVNISEYRDDNRIEIPVNIEASPVSVPSSSSLTILNQQRSFRYTINVDPSLRPLDRQKENKDERLFWEEEKKLETSSNRNPEENAENSEVNISQEYKASEAEKNSGEQSQINSLTFVLVLGVIVSFVYIMKVI